MGGSNTDDGHQRTMATVERSMVQLRRSMTRRTLARLAAQKSGQAVDPALADVLDAVAEGPVGSGQELTVGLVATRLGIDPSRASRLVAAGIKAGYLRRVASQADGRRIHLELTAVAEEFAVAAHHARQGLYEQLMREWSEPDRAIFAELLSRFTEALTELRNQ
ncbi:MAG TPA: MarR family transcriptional regulator [Pseudonocardiaceae bacterium]|nr:MarR family transcriptional regulator [Pseudonocardiaceae bacterium]